MGIAILPTPYSLLPTPYSLKIKNSVPHPSEKCYKYREIIQKLIQEYAGDRYTRKDVDRESIFDTKNDHYQIVNVGWENNHRVYGCIRHFDIKQGKIWLQYNGTEIDFAEELVKAEVPNQDIVIGFHSPFMRQFTKYAVS